MSALQEQIVPENYAAPAIEINGLTHFYPQRKAGRRNKKKGDNFRDTSKHLPALSDVTFSINKNEIFAILGPNGGGKTTLFRILSTMLRPISQSPDADTNSANPPQQNKSVATIFGLDCVSDSKLVRQHFGIVFQSPSLDNKLTAEENLIHQGHLYGLRGDELKQKIDYWLEHFNLLDKKHIYVGNFSGGMRRRVEIAKALLHDPKLLLMDEPATGLDPAARRQMWYELDKLRKQSGITIVFTTHLMEEAEGCDRLAILSQGELIALDTPENLKAKIGGQVVTVVPGSDLEAEALDDFAKNLEDNFGPFSEHGRPKVIDEKIRFEKPDAAQIIGAITSKWPEKVKSVTIGQPTLEDVFLQMTGNSLT